MKNVLVITVMAFSLFLGSLGSYVSMATADEGLHFHCSVCDAHGHGSLYHDKNK